MVNIHYSVCCLFALLECYIIFVVFWAGQNNQTLILLGDFRATDAHSTGAAWLNSRTLKNVGPPKT